MKNIGPSTHIFLCYLPLTLFGMLSVGLFIGELFILLPLVLSISLIPLMDLLFDAKQSSVFKVEQFSEVQQEALAWSPRIYAISYVFFFLVAIYAASGLSNIGLASMVASFSLIGAIGFAANHELLHRRTKIDHGLHQVSEPSSVLSTL